MDKKAGLKAFSIGSRDIFNIDPSTIVVEPGFNARDFATPENQEHVARLKASILECGIKEPLTVRLHDGKVSLVGGECRLRAVMLARDDGVDIKTVPCQADDRYTNDADRIAELITRNSGKQLTPLEQASVCKRLLAFGWTQAQVAKKLAVSDSYVSHLCSLLTMPEEARQMVSAGQVSAATALETIRTEGDANGVATLTQAVSSAKSSGKKRATPSAVRKASTSQEIRLSRAQGEAALKFIKFVSRRAASIAEARAAADKLLEDFAK